MSLLGVALAATGSPVWAQDASASAAVGGGLFGGEAVAAADLGVDLAGDGYALGLGGRLRWVAGEGVRGRDWDAPSEWATVIRYGAYVRDPDDPDALRVSVALGALGDVRLGRGGIVRGYTTGLDVDHHGLGGQVRLERAGLGFEGVIDDMVAPRVTGVRAYWYRHRADAALEFGASAAADVSAPRAATIAPGTMPALEAGVLPMAAVDAGISLRRGEGRQRSLLEGTLYAELIAISTVAAGAHVGVEVDGWLEGTRLTARTELQAGTGGYVAGWVGPLYERDRVHLGEPTMDTQAEPAPTEPAPTQLAPTQLDRARAGGLGHLGAHFDLRVADPALGELALSYARRPGLPDVATARLAAPSLRALQGALWAALEPAGGARTVAVEVRVRLPRRLFVVAEAARLYRGADPATAPAAAAPAPAASFWSATLSLGATLDVAGARSAE
ncbi:hypothetical protein [Haliangium sp.]|uniref:hypothetical protein n=1 Tax=Haliangium sp. TaxID=2663208 RepID=UPI003D0A3BF9